MSFLPRSAADLSTRIHREELPQLACPRLSSQIAYKLDKEKKHVTPLLTPKLISHQPQLSEVDGRHKLNRKGEEKTSLAQQWPVLAVISNKFFPVLCLQNSGLSSAQKPGCKRPKLHLC